MWEVRTQLSSNRIARVLFFKHGAELVAVNGFIKKSQATPKEELRLAIGRKKDVESGA